MTRERNVSYTLSPAGSRTPVQQQAHKHPRHPRLVIAIKTQSQSQGLLFSEARKPYAEAAGHGRRVGVVPTTHPVSRKSPARDESSFGCAVQTRQFLFVFLFEVCWLLSFFSPEVPVQGELVRARGFRSRAFNSALARLVGCRELVGVCPRGHLGRTFRGKFLGLRLLL